MYEWLFQEGTVYWNFEIKQTIDKLLEKVLYLYPKKEEKVLYFSFLSFVEDHTLLVLTIVWVDHQLFLPYYKKPSHNHLHFITSFHIQNLSLHFPFYFNLYQEFFYLTSHISKASIKMKVCTLITMIKITFFYLLYHS
jgi:hypothetical protein